MKIIGCALVDRFIGRDLELDDVDSVLKFGDPIGIGRARRASASR